MQSGKITMNLAHRNNNWILCDDDELRTGRSLKVVAWSSEWSLEKQKEYAVRYGMCPRVCDVMSGENVTKRVCGKRMKKSRANRKNCSRCTLVYTPSGIPVEKSHQTTATQSDAVAEGEPRQLQERWGPLVSIPHDVPTVQTIMEGRYDATYAKQYRANIKSGLKKFLAHHGKTLDCPAPQFVNIFDRQGWLAVVEEVDKMPSKHNMLGAIVGILRALGQQETADSISKWQKSKRPTREVKQLVQPDRVEKIDAIAKKLDVKISGQKRPAFLLLEAIRNRVYGYLPSNSLERKFLFVHLMAWWLPGARNTSSELTVHKGLVTDFEHVGAHHVCVNKAGEVIGLYFGALKFTKTLRFQRLWRKRFMVRPKGIQLHDQKPVIPCHMNEDEFEMWWKIIATTLEDQLRETGSRHGASVFPCAPIAPIEEDIFGATIGSYLSRMIFRNAYTDVDKFFIQKVMQHCEEVDRSSYVKPRLMDGPW